VSQNSEDDRRKQAGVTLSLSPTMSEYEKDINKSVCGDIEGVSLYNTLGDRLAYILVKQLR